MEYEAPMSEAVGLVGVSSSGWETPIDPFDIFK